MITSVVAVKGLRKTYGEKVAVKGLDFRVEKGQIFGLLGPNGAGKTTTIELSSARKRATVGRLSCSVVGWVPMIRVFTSAWAYSFNRTFSPTAYAWEKCAG